MSEKSRFGAGEEPNPDPRTSLDAYIGAPCFYMLPGGQKRPALIVETKGYGVELVVFCSADDELPQTETKNRPADIMERFQHVQYDKDGVIPRCWSWI